MKKELGTRPLAQRINRIYVCLCVCVHEIKRNLITYSCGYEVMDNNGKIFLNCIGAKKGQIITDYYRRRRRRKV